LKALTLRLSDPMYEQLQIPIKEGRKITITQIIREAIDDYIINNPCLFARTIDPSQEHSMSKTDPWR